MSKLTWNDTARRYPSYERLVPTGRLRQVPSYRCFWSKVHEHWSVPYLSSLLWLTSIVDGAISIPQGGQVYNGFVQSFRWTQSGLPAIQVCFSESEGVVC
jgi:hypothetical protein